MDSSIPWSRRCGPVPDAQRRGSGLRGTIAATGTTSSEVGTSEALASQMSAQSAGRSHSITPLPK